MRSLLLIAALPLLATFAPADLFTGPNQPLVAEIMYRPIPLDESDLARRDLGPLRLLGGWQIKGSDPRLGGLSAMAVEEGGILALSDAGWIIELPLPVDGPAAAGIRPVPDGPGSPSDKRDRDTESLVVKDDAIWFGFERHNMVWQFRRSDWTTTARGAPAGMRGWGLNSGAEAMVRFDDGRFLVFAEGRQDGGTSPAVLFDGDPSLPGTKSAAFEFRPPQGYRITDAARLPDGKLLLLTRRFTMLEGVSAKLLVADPAGIRQGAVLTARQIAHFEPPLATDNYEALSVTREEDRTIAWIASDDNYNPLQRTLLLKFALEPSPPARRR